MRSVASLRACSEGANRVAQGDLTTEFRPQSDRDVMGTALAEICRRLGVGAEAVFAAGDWLNDLPMLDKRFAHFLAAPANSFLELRFTPALRAHADSSTAPSA